MFARQAEFQGMVLGGVKPWGEYETPADAMAAFREQWMAIVKELGEAIDEVGWKPWATSNHVNADAFKAEMVDAWHFFMNLCLMVGMTPDDLFSGYLNKLVVNIKRVVGGYDGVSTKCPGCKAAYDDPATKCRPGGTRDAGGKPIKFNPWCFREGRHIIPAEAEL